MIMQRQPDGSYEQIGFIKSKDGETIDTIVDSKGDVYFTQGFTREISGIPPLTLDSIGKNTLDYKIYGNSVQDGTPTPENPIEVQSVGDKTKNLWNGDVEQGAVVNTGVLSDSNTRIRSKPIKVVGGLEYTISSNLYIRMICCYKGEKYVSTIADFFGDQPKKQASFTVPDGADTLRIGFMLNVSGTANVTPDMLEDAMLELGSEATDYEPYGYKIPVVTTGKNLFDVANTQWTNNNYLSETGELVSNNAWNVTDYIPVWGMVFTINNRIGVVPCICLYDANKNLIASQSYAGHKVTTVTANELAHYCRFSLYARGDVSSDTVQLELGTESTDYEPYHEPITTNIYLDEPLKTGDILKYPENVLVHADGTAETLALPEIPTFDGTTVISADTEIQPSNMEITYKGKKKTEV